MGTLHDLPMPEWLRDARAAFFVPIALVIAAELMSAADVAVTRETRWADPVTGSVKYEVASIWGVDFGPFVEASPLEARLIKSGIPWTQTWQHCTSKSRNMFGRVYKRSCGSLPSIHSAHISLNHYAASATDEELSEFVRIMQAGTEAQQEELIDAIFKKWLESRPAD